MLRVPRHNATCDAVRRCCVRGQVTIAVELTRARKEFVFDQCFGPASTQACASVVSCCVCVCVLAVVPWAAHFLAACSVISCHLTRS